MYRGVPWVKEGVNRVQGGSRKFDAPGSQEGSKRKSKDILSSLGRLQGSSGLKGHQEGFRRLRGASCLVGFRGSKKTSQGSKGGNKAAVSGS